MLLVLLGTLLLLFCHSLPGCRFIARGLAPICLLIRYFQKGVFQNEDLFRKKRHCIPSVNIAMGFISTPEFLPLPPLPGLVSELLD